MFCGFRVPRSFVCCEYRCCRGDCVRCVIAQGTCMYAGAMGEIASQDLEPLRLWQDLM
jgi:hypothetical protein